MSMFKEVADIQTAETLKLPVPKANFKTIAVKPSEIHIHTENAFILTMLEENLDRWEQNGYVTTKGEPVANGDLWKQLKEKAREHLLLSEPGKHEYSMWIQEQLKRATANR